MAFHVFVEGATDATPAGVARLAEAIAKHYGLGAADLHARLQKGRFRVKGNTDRETAEKYRRDLEILGARCVIEEATAQNSQKNTPLPFPAVRPATPVAGTPVLPPKPAAAKPATPPSGTPQYQSGLSAAFSGETPAANLGALAGDGLSFSLSSVDGADEQPKGDVSFAPPESALPASIGPAPEKPKAKAKAEKPKDEPLDMFAPPDQQGEEFKVDIASDEKEQTAKKRPSTPVPDESPRASSDKLARPQSEPAARKSQPSLQQPSEPAAVVKSSKLGPLADPRARFAAGVLLAVLIGFVPAHLVASMREKSAYKEIDNKVLAAQQLADTAEVYATLDRMRTDQLEAKKGEQRNAAIIALAIWALVGGGIAFAWFKKVSWDNFD
ncbi:MAG TPA: hypothetical protein VFV99_12575 [Kofleriaceae bacterium]|nr:hypothetical protein [Kofleriaceae bacterium]